MQYFKRIFTPFVSLLPILGIFTSDRIKPTAVSAYSGNAAQEAIAYVHPNDVTGDEIHL